MGLQTGSEFRHHAISAKLPAAFSNEDKTLVVQVRCVDSWIPRRAIA
jgi:hypothetical protein